MITLNPVSTKDASPIFDALDLNREIMRTWLPFVDTTITVQHTLEFIRITQENGEKTFTIRFNDTFAGLCGIKNIDTYNRRAEIGYWVSPVFWGNGIATEAVKRLMKLGFEELNMNRLQIRAAVNNVRSLKIPEKLGFTCEGIERDGELLVNGFADIKVFSFLQKDYLSD